LKTLLEKAGVRAEHFGDSAGKFQLENLAKM